MTYVTDSEQLGTEENGYPSPIFHIEPLALQIVGDFRFDLPGYRDFLLEQGVSPNAINKLAVSCIFWAQETREAIQGDEPVDTYRLGAYRKLKDGSSEITLSVGDAYCSSVESETAEKEQTLTVADVLNHTLMHETGHFLDSELHGIKPSIKERCVRGLAKTALIMHGFVSTATERNIVQAMTPLHLAYPVVTGGILGASIASTLGAERIVNKLKPIVYAQSPREAFANAFELEHRDMAFITTRLIIGESLAEE